jgi:lycopene cyclase domain-containing protein
LVAFACFSSAVESIALQSGWWEFNLAKILGVRLARIPLEEYAMFLGFYALIASHWESLLELD